MTKLFLDEFITREGFSSTEDYIDYYVKGHAPWIEFPNVNYYFSLLENNFLKIHNVVRTSDGVMDECYEIIENGMLRGITEISAHQGMKGIFSPKEILKGERIFRNWAVYGKILERNIYLMKNVQNKP